MNLTLSRSTKSSGWRPREAVEEEALDDLLAVLYAHPQVYVDVGVIAWILPRAAFYRHLRGIVEAGFGNRVMSGP